MIATILALIVAACLFAVGPLLAGRLARWIYDRFNRPRSRP